MRGGKRAPSQANALTAHPPFGLPRRLRGIARPVNVFVLTARTRHNALGSERAERLVGGFRQGVEASVPALRRYARALTRDAEVADDLVQDTLVRALRSEHLFH